MREMRQFAALPIVEIDGETHVLLISSRRMRRWVIPKGWPKTGLAPHELAELEAYEEAGVRGVISNQPIGAYTYVKRLHLFAWARCVVDVFPLYANRQSITWPEKTSRELRWLRPHDAAKLVKERELAAMLGSLQSTFNHA